MAWFDPGRKLGISVLEAVAMALLVIAGLGASLAVEQGVHRSMRDAEPRAEAIELKHGVPITKAALEQAHDELKVLRAQHLERRATSDRERVTQEQLRASYPELGRLSDDFVRVRAATASPQAAALNDRAVAEASVIALNAEVQRHIASKAAQTVALAGLTAGSIEHAMLTAQLDLTTKQLDARVKELIAEEERLTRLQAAVAVLVARYPAVQEVAPEVLAAYGDALEKRQAAEALERVAAERVAQRQAELLPLHQQSDGARDAAEKELLRARDGFAWERSLIAGTAAVITGIACVLLLGFIMSIVAARGRVELNGPLTVMLGLALVLVLGLFQVAGTLGAALGGVVLLLAAIAATAQVPKATDT